MRAVKPPIRISAEQRWVLIFGLLVMLATSVPYVVGWFNQSGDRVFTGFVFGVDDGNSYIAKMLSGADGAWLFRTPYTAYPQGGVVAFPLYILLGKLTLGVDQHSQLILLYHISRFFAGLLAVLATYRFISVFIQRIRYRRWALALAVLGGGLGWVLLLLGRPVLLDSLPLEFYSPESFGFLELYGLPHLSLARAFLLWGLSYYLGTDIKSARGERVPINRDSPSKFGWWMLSPAADEQRSALYAGLSLFIVGLAQPLTVLSAWGVLAAHLSLLAASRLLRSTKREVAWFNWWKYLHRAAGIILISSPIVIYNSLALWTDPFIQSWIAQNIIESPHPVHYMLAYVLVSPLVIAGVRGWKPEEFDYRSLPIAWIAILPLLAYAPHNLQRRLPEGVWMAFVVLAVYGLMRVDRRMPALSPAARLSLLLALPSTIFLLAGGVGAALGTAVPVFRPVEEVSVFKRLAGEAAGGDIVLAAYETGNALPAWAPVRVVIGHGPESIFLDELRPRVAAFYQPGTLDSARLDLLEEFHVRYVIWGPAERSLGSWDPQGAGYLELIHREGDYALFMATLRDEP